MTINTALGIEEVPAEARGLRHHVVRALRQAIIDGEFKPGDRILEEEISARMGISRGPVREALRQLEQEGFVASSPYRPTVVLDLTDVEVRDVLIPIRVVLEKFAFAAIVGRLSDQNLAELNNVIKQMRQAAALNDRAALAEADIGFHMAVLRLAGHKHTMMIWNAIAQRTKAYFLRFPRDIAPTESVKEHERLLAALQGGDIVKIQRLLEEHIAEQTAPAIRVQKPKGGRRPAR